RLMGTRRAEDPVTPEPVQLHARLVPHETEESGRGRMLERPRADVLAEGRVESLLAKHLVTQQLHHERWLLISAPEEIADLDRLLDQRLLITRLRMIRVEMERMHLDRIPVRRAGEVFRRAGEIDERVEALVHPRIQPL